MLSRTEDQKLRKEKKDEEEDDETAATSVAVLLSLLAVGVCFALIIQKKVARIRSRRVCSFPRRDDDSPSKKYVVEGPDRPPRPLVKKPKPPPIKTSFQNEVINPCAGADDGEGSHQHSSVEGFSVEDIESMRHTPTPSPIRRSPNKQRIVQESKAHMDEKMSPLLRSEERRGDIEEEQREKELRKKEDEVRNPSRAKETMKNEKKEEKENDDEEKEEVISPLVVAEAIVPEPMVEGEIEPAVSYATLASPPAANVVATPNHHYSPGGTVLANIIRMDAGENE